MKSSTCFGKINQQPLSVFSMECLANEAAKHANNEYGRDLVSYHCNVCSHWHLTPKRRQTPSRTCTFCRGGNGEYKELYPTKEVSKQRAKIINDERFIKLKSYKCPHYDGWHLTKVK
ncbi:hypothetical protein L4C36_20585 [Photobacterium japonica]|uniref:hypothetical protein n=1 Tax=Photobacterium japonica TaxID=2910235 RepID=UPI003D09EE33